MALVLVILIQIFKRNCRDVDIINQGPPCPLDLLLNLAKTTTILIINVFIVLQWACVMPIATRIIYGAVGIVLYHHRRLHILSLPLWIIIGILANKLHFEFIINKNMLIVRFIEIRGD